MSDNKLYWIDRNGQQVDIDTMSIEYLRNTLKMIVRNIERNNQNRNKELGNIEENFQEEKIREIEEDNFYFNDGL
tara:strand:+ start:2229 stop:2453 length:225 start_codon:yes stop_codon:yes gene_type:complete